MDHVGVFNLDYSSNHDAMAPECPKANNLKSSWGPRRTKNKSSGVMDSLAPVRGSNTDGSDTMMVGDLGENVPTFGTKQGQLKVGGKQFYIFQAGDPVPHFEKNKKMKEIDYVGKDKQLKQLLWERGKYVEGMVLTTKEKSLGKKSKATRNNDRRWNKGDIVFFQDVDSEEDPELFRIMSVPENHIDVKSAQDVIDIEFLEFGNKKTAYGVPAGRYYYPSKKIYKQKAKDLSAVKPKDFTVALGKVTNKNKYWISIDVSSVWARMNGKEEENVNAVNVANDVANDDANDDPVIVANPNENKLNPLDMREVWSQTPTAKNIKSLIELLITDHDLPPASRRGHGLLMSAKFHCECAGVGIEYCFGRVKWWYNKFHRHTSDGLREDSEASFLPNVVTIHHMRKFARKSRDYMRVYRATKDWPDIGDIMVRTENCIKELKTHRCAMDTDLVFVSESIDAAPVDYNK